jgi:hypothetical protein
MTSTDVPGATRVGRLPWPFHPWAAPLWLLSLLSLWWAELHGQLAAGWPASAPAASLGLAAAWMTAARVGGQLVEAAFYTAWWRRRGRVVGFARLSLWIVSLSVLDLWASRLSEIARAHPGGIARALAPIAGIALLKPEIPGASAGLWAGFGTLGLLCLARIVLTAHVQRLGIGGGLGPPLRLTLAVWTLTRVANWWLVDLLRGRSPVG